MSTWWCADCAEIVGGLVVNDSTTETVAASSETAKRTRGAAFMIILLLSCGTMYSCNNATSKSLLLLLPASIPRSCLLARLTSLVKDYSHQRAKELLGHRNSASTIYVRTTLLLYIFYRRKLPHIHTHFRPTRPSTTQFGPCVDCILTGELRLCVQCISYKLNSSQILTEGQTRTTCLLRCWVVVASCHLPPR